MVKVFRSIVAALCFCVLFAAQAMAAPTAELDGQPLSFDQPPVMENGRTLVPLRAIFEAMGADVTWDAESQTATAIKGDKVVVLKLGSTTPTVNGQVQRLDVPAKVLNGRILAPLRFVGEAFGGTVDWDAATQRIAISTDAPAKGTGVDTKPSPQQTAKGVLCPVTRVVDGDTIEVTFNGQKEKVRLIGVDTPETVHPTRGEEPYGKEASNYTKSRLDGQTVNLEFDVQERDQYGRLLAYVWIGNELFNETLVKEGYAQISTFPPNVKYVDVFRAAQEQARAQGKGLWGLDQTVTPSEPAATSGKFVGSLQSDKYHYPTCRWAKEIKPENEIWFKDAEDAKAHGYKPCGVCKP